MENNHFSLKRVMVPVDFSENSHSVLAYVSGLSRAFGAQITLLYVVPTTVVPLEAYELAPDYETLTQWGEENLANLKKEEFGDADHVTTSVRTGEPYVEIVEAAKETECDLIVMSTHGHSGFRHLMLGSTTERVVRSSSIPVLTRRLD